MGALTSARMGQSQTIHTASFPLKAATTAFRGGMACGDTSDGSVTPGAAGSATLVRIGEFAQDYDNSAGTATVQVLVRLEKEIKATWYDNATGANKVLAANLFGDCYILDDHTVTLASSGNSKAGRVWAVDSVKGVCVESQTL